MSNSGRFEYTIGFKTDDSGLKEARKALQDIQKISFKDTGSQEFSEINGILAEAKKHALELDTALSKAFNPKMGTTNLSILRQELSQLNLNQIQKDMAAIGPQGELAFNKVAAAAMHANLQIKQGNTILEKFGRTLYRNVEWLLSGQLINTITGVFTKAYGFTKNLDASLNDIRIVTGKSADEMERYGQKARETAAELGKGTRDITEASLIFFQQGLNEQEVAARTEVTAKMANVTDQSAGAVADQMTAIWNGFQVGSDELEHYADVMTAIAASTASSSQELAGSISKVSSIAHTTGVDMEQLSAMISTVISVTRDSPETVGTAFKTIFARMDDLVEDGTDEFGVSLGRVSSHLKAMGIEILNEDGSLRDLGDTLTEIGDKWKSYSREQQIAIAEQMGGKRQWNQVLALFDSWDMYRDALDVARDSTGALQEQQDIYMDRVETHLQELSTAWERVYSQIFNAKDLNKVIDAITSIVDKVGEFLETVGGIKPVLDMVISLMLQAFGPKMGQEITRIGNNVYSAFINKNSETSRQAILQQFGTQVQDSAIVQELVNKHKEMLKYKQVMTEEDEKQFNSYLDQKVVLDHNTKELDKQLQAAKDFIATRPTLQNNFNKAGGFDTSNFSLEDIGMMQQNAQILMQKDTLDMGVEQYSLTQNLKEFNLERERQIQGLQIYINEIKKYKDEIENLTPAQAKDNEQINTQIQNINKLLNQLNNYQTELSESTASSDELAASLKRQAEAINNTTNALEKKSSSKALQGKMISDNALQGLLAQKGQSYNLLGLNTDKIAQAASVDKNYYMNLAQQLQSLPLTNGGELFSTEQVSRLQAVINKTDDLKKIQAAFVNELKITQNGIKNLDNVINNHTEKQKANAEAVGQAWDNAHDKMINQKKVQLGINNFAQLAGTISQAAMAFQQIQNIGKIIKDEDIKDSEKMNKIFSSLIMTLPLFVSTISNLSKTSFFTNLKDEINTNKQYEEIRKQVRETAKEQQRAEKVVQEAHQKTTQAKKIVRQEQEKMIPIEQRYQTLSEQNEKITDKARATAKKQHAENTRYRYETIRDERLKQQAAINTAEANETEALASETTARKDLKEAAASHTAAVANEEEAAAAGKAAAAELVKKVAIAAVVAIIAVAIIAYKKIKEAQEELEETNKRNLEIVNDHIKSNQDLIKSNKKLLESFQDYDKIWESFKKGKVAIDEVKSSIEQLAESLGLEEDEEYLRLKRLAEYTKNYEKLNKYIAETQRNNIIRSSAYAFQNEVNRYATQREINWINERKQQSFTQNEAIGKDASHWVNVKKEFENEFGKGILDYVAQNAGGYGAYRGFNIDFQNISYDQIPQIIDFFQKQLGQNDNLDKVCKGILQELEQYLPTKEDKVAKLNEEIWKIFSGERKEPLTTVKTDDHGVPYTISFSGFYFDENMDESEIQKQLKDFALFYQGYRQSLEDFISYDEAYQIGFNWFNQVQNGAKDALTSIDFKNSLREDINNTIRDINKSGTDNIEFINDDDINNIEKKLKKAGFDLIDIDWSQVAEDKGLLKGLTDGIINNDDIKKLLKYRNQVNYLTQDYQALCSTIDNVIETIEKGNSSQDKILSSKDFESILEAEEELRLLFGGDNSEVAKAYDTIAQAQAGELSVYSDAFKEALKDIKQAMDDAEIEKGVQRFNKSWNEMIDSVSSSATNVTHTTEDLSNALKELTDADYSIEVAIAVKNENLYQDLQKSYKEIVDTAEKIKENFVIDISDMDDLEEMFPGILEQAQIFSDGTVHLNQTIANSAMQAAQTEVESQKQALVDKLNLQKQELQGKVDLYDKIITAAEQIINDEEGKKEHLTAYKDLLNQLEEKDNKKSKDEQAKDNRDYYNKELENYKDASKANAEYWRIADENRAAYEERRGEYKTIEDSKVYQDIMAQQFQENDVPGLDIDAFDDDFINKLLGKNNRNFKAFKDALGDSLSQFKKNRQNLLDQISSIDSTLLKINTLDLATQNTLKHIGESTNSKKDNADATKEQTEAEAELLDLLNEEIDVYHDLNIAIKQVNNELSSLQKQEEKLTGDALTKNLEEQNKLLEQQIQNYQELARRKTADLVSTRSYLESQGMNFDENGNMMNHDEVILNKMEEVNNLRSEYNSLSAEEQEGFKERVEAAEEEYEMLKKKIDLYDELQTDTIPQALADIAEAENKIIENNIKTFDLKFQIEFDKVDAEKEYREFRNKVIKDLKEDDILGNTLASYEDLSYYRNIQGTGKIQILSQELSELQQAQRDLAETGTSIFGDNAAAIEERIKSVTSELYKAQIEEKEAINAIEDQYLDAIDTVGDKIKEQIDAYSKISDLIEHDINLIKLLYGEEAATEAVQKFQQQQEKQLWQQYDMYVKWSAQAQKEMNKVEIGSDAWKKWRSQWEEAQTGIRQSLEDIAQSIIDTYTTTIDTIYQKLDEKLGGALGLESMKSTYDFMQEQADKYLDTVNGAYAIEKLSKDMQDKINATDDIKAQQRLSELKDQEIKNLREKDKLTQYDVDRANALYDIEVKKIALKEAQQNKSKMRLRRDSQGNYSYQFVADEDSIATAAQELADAQNTLFNLDKDAYKNNLDEFYKLFTDFKEKQKQIYIDYADDAEKRQEALLQLEKTYGPAINDVIEQNANIRINHEESAFEDIGELYNLNVEDLQNMADTEKDILMNQLVPNWTNGIQDMIGQIVGEGGFLAAIQESNAELEKNVYLFKKDLGNVENAAKEQFGNDIANGNDSIVNTMESLIDSNETIIAQWATLIDELKEIVNYVVTLSKTGIRVIEDGNIAENDNQSIPIQLKNSENTTGQSTYSLNNNGYAQTTYNSINKNKSLNKTLKPKENLSPQAAQFLESAQNDPTWTKADIKQALNMINFVEAHNNQKDTSKQILDSISDKVRQNITALTRMLSFDKNSNIISSIGNEVKTEPASVQQNNYINADFPNAKDVYEILLAFETLQNQATQMAYTTRR